MTHKTPFKASEIHYRVLRKAGSRYVVHAYVDARQVCERLDVLDPHWSDAYTGYLVEPAGTKKRGGQNGTLVEQQRASVVCAITANGVTRTDVGETVDFFDSEKLRKTAYSDALKKAAVKFGIGAYLRDLPEQFVPESGVQYGRINSDALTKLRGEYAKFISDTPAASENAPQQGLSEDQTTTLMQLALRAGFDRDDARDRVAKVTPANYEAARKVLQEKADAQVVEDVQETFPGTQIVFGEKAGA